MFAVFNRFDRRYEEAARDLYADTPCLLRRVLLPLLMPGIVAGAMLAFTLSLDDLVIAHSSQPLRVSRPQPGFSEQAPQDWWQAACAGLDDLKAQGVDDLRAYLADKYARWGTAARWTNATRPLWA